MGQRAQYSQLNAGEKKKYMELVNRFIELTEKVDRTNRRATSLINMVLSGGTHRLWQMLSIAILRSKIKQVEDAFRDLKKKISEIKDYKWGTNVSPEKHDKGFTHGFILTFNTEKDRDAYLVHPDHKAFGKIVGPVLADVFVIDFWTKE